MTVTTIPRPPVANGTRLATLHRSKRGGPVEELRVTLDEYQGHPYIGVRVWTLDARSKAWWPVKAKGVSIRLHEAEEVADALREALRLVKPDGAATPGPTANSRGAAPRPQAGRPLALPEAASGGESFDEFDDAV